MNFTSNKFDVYELVSLSTYRRLFSIFLVVMTFANVENAI